MLYPRQHVNGLQMYSPESLQRHRALAKQVERSDSRVLAVVSVGLGVAQLLLLRWLEAELPRQRVATVAGPVFLAYMALVGALLWRMLRRRRAAAPRCPACGLVLEGLSERVAIATGRCDGCGGQVVDPALNPAEPAEPRA